MLRDFRLDLRSLVTCALHTRPGYRDFVIRVKGEGAEALVREIKAKYGEGVSISLLPRFREGHEPVADRTFWD